MECKRRSIQSVAVDIMIKKNPPPTGHSMSENIVTVVTADDKRDVCSWTIETRRGQIPLRLLLL